MNSKERLLSFYFGSMSEKERLQIEHDLLVDPETLIEFLDLKRDLEASPLSTTNPSPSLWHRLKPKDKKQKRLYLSFSIGAAVAMGLVAIFINVSQPEPIELVQPEVSKVLFDSSSELPASSGVL